jgi:hypothetical protein
VSFYEDWDYPTQPDPVIAPINLRVAGCLLLVALALAIALWCGCEMGQR